MTGAIILLQGLEWDSHFAGKGEQPSLAVSYLSER